MSKFLNKRYASLETYTPGEQPQGRKFIKLNTNESPYEPSDSVKKAVADEAKKLMLYPDPECGELRDKIAKLYGKKRENIYVSNGSDDILSFAFMAFCDKNKTAYFPEISYGFYEVYANLYGVKYEKIPLNSDFTINPSDYFSKNGFIAIANPNAPTGAALSLDKIESIVKSNPNSVVLIDEAYVDFGAQSSYNLIEKYDNLLVVQTYSKSRSMAGARLGFAIAQPQLIADLERIKYSTNPYCINRITLSAGIAAINDNDYYMDNCKKIIKTRDYTTMQLQNLGFEVIPSSTNFIFAKSNEIGGGILYEKLKENGILVRHFSNPKISDFNRITIGTKEQMDALINCVKQILKRTENL